MPISFEARKRLLRLHGIADELLSSARVAKEQQALDAVAAELDVLAAQVHEVLETADAELAAEFQQVVVEPIGNVPEADVRAAVLAGWLKAGLAAEAIDAQRQEQAPPRKHSIGFRIRSVLTRDSGAGEPDAGSPVERG
jgi:hypothetical protein